MRKLEGGRGGRGLPDLNSHVIGSTGSREDIDTPGEGCLECHYTILSPQLLCVQGTGVHRVKRHLSSRGGEDEDKRGCKIVWDTVEPPYKGHYGTNDFVPCREVVPISEVK